MTTLPEERVRAASAAWVWIPDGATRVETDEYLAVRYPDWFEHPLQLVALHPRRPVGAVLDEVLDRCRDLGRPDIACWVRLDAPEGLESALQERGGMLDETVDVLARPLTDLPRLEPAVEVELRWSDDLDTFADAIRVGAEVFGGGVPDRAALEAQHRGEVEKLAAGGGGAVVAYLDGRPVGSGGITVSGADGRLWGGAVLPEARGRGIYRALLAARLGYAVRHGCDLAIVKGRVDTSAPILRRAGFAAYGQERAYLVTF